MKLSFFLAYFYRLLGLNLNAHYLRSPNQERRQGIERLELGLRARAWDAERAGDHLHAWIISSTFPVVQGGPAGWTYEMRARRVSLAKYISPNSLAR